MAVYAGWIGGSVVVMAGLVVALGTLLRQIAALPADGATARVVVGVTFGLYLGWICVATCANIASWLVGLGVSPAGPAATAATIAVLVVAGLLLRRTPHRTFATALAGAIAWGLAWVAVGRFVGELANQPVAYAAVAAAVAVVALWALRVRSPQAVASHRH